MSARKIGLWCIPVVLVLAGAAYFFFFRGHQVLRFSDDSKITLLAVTYGKKHAPPQGKPAKNGARPRRGTTINTTNDTLVLWVQQEYDNKEWHNFQYYVYDKAGAACVQSSSAYGGGRGNDVVGIRVDAFPRRNNKFYVSVQENGNNFNETAEKKFVISNPARGSFPKWTAESFPITKDDDDLSVTLTKLSANAQMPYNRGDSDSDGPMNKCIQAAFHVERDGKPVSNWQPVSIVTTDATGNSVNGYVTGANPMNRPTNPDKTITFQWGLWPDEPVWKIRMEFSQQSDFAGYETWSVPNIPLQPGTRNDFWNNRALNSKTNVPVAEADLNGVHLKILSVKEFTDANGSQPNGGLTIQTDSDLKAMRMTVKITDEHANEISYWENGTRQNGNVTSHLYGLRDLDATNVNVTIALHKSRYVEFLVKPDATKKSGE